MKKLKSEAPWLIALIACVGILWCVTYDRLSGPRWGVPTAYVADHHGGDTLSCLAAIKAASEWDQLPLVSKSVERLGAPYRANWNDFPTSEEFPIFFMGVLARIFGLFEASNLIMMLAHVTGALVFYLCCRMMRFQKLWSFVAAVLFGFTYYVFYRGLGHLFIALIYTVPMAVVSCWLIGASRRMKWGDKFCWFCLITAGVMGVSNPYNLNIYCQLLAIAIVLQFFTKRRKQNLQIGAAALALAVGAFAVMNLDTFFYQTANGKNPDPMERNYYESEMFALKPMELIVPPGSHHIEKLADLGRFYGAILMSRGEIYSAYLGWIGFGCLVWLFAEAVRRALKRSRQRLSVHSLQAGWIFAYAVNGGLNCIFALGGLTVFRASNRFSIFLSAIALFFLASRLSVMSRRWSQGVRFAVAAGILVIGLYDQIPSSKVAPIAGNPYMPNKELVEADRAFAEEMEAKLPPGAMVFQTPAMVYPESLQQVGMLPYEYFRPYFFTKKLRFSFGNNKGRPRDNWQWEVEKLPAAQMVAALEKYGFAAIYLNRRAFQDGGQKLLKELNEAGKTQMFEDERREQVCVVLNPSPNPELPPGGDELAITYARVQWQKAEGTPPDRQVWSNGDGRISFYNSAKGVTSVRLKGAIGSVSRRRVTVQMGGREIWSGQLNPNQAAPLEFVVDAKSGNNVLEFKTDEPASPFPNQPQRAPAAFVVINLRATPAK